MGSATDKASGLANEAIGNVKQGVGKVVGSEKLKAQGAAQELKGDAARRPVRRDYMTNRAGEIALEISLEAALLMPAHLVQVFVQSAQLAPRKCLRQGVARDMTATANTPMSDAGRSRCQ